MTSLSREDSDKVAQTMGTYLLQGYTMLDDYCPNCKSPLMRKKTEPEFCVFCDLIKKNDAFVETKKNSDEEICLESLSEDNNNGDNDLKINEKFYKIKMNLLNQIESLSSLNGCNNKVTRHENIDEILSLMKVLEKIIAIEKKF